MDGIKTTRPICVFVAGGAALTSRYLATIGGFQEMGGGGYADSPTQK
jgi:hypothetical protein